MIDRGTDVFLDTGYLVALENADDQNHPSAREHFDALGRMPTLTTTSYVLDEVVTFFNVRGRHAKAVEVGETLLGSPSVEIVHVGENLLRRGFGLLRDRPDKDYSLTASRSSSCASAGSPWPSPSTDTSSRRVS